MTNGLEKGKQIEPELTPEQRESLRKLADVAPEEIVKQETLRLALTNALEGLQEADNARYHEVRRIVTPDMPVINPDSLVAGYLMAPDDAQRREALAELLSRDRKMLLLLKKIGALVTES